MKIKVEKLTNEEILSRNIKEWPIWEKEVSRFPWTYDSVEECLIIEGKIIVETDHETVELRAGDFVTFPGKLNCVWDIKEPVRKYYNFP